MNHAAVRFKQTREQLIAGYPIDPLAYGYYLWWLVDGERRGCISGHDYSQLGYYGSLTVPKEYVDRILATCQPPGMEPTPADLEATFPAGEDPAETEAIVGPYDPAEEGL